MGRDSVDTGLLGEVAAYASNLTGARLLATSKDPDRPRLRGTMFRRRAERHMRRGKADILGASVLLFSKLMVEREW